VEHPRINDRTVHPTTRPRSGHLRPRPVEKAAVARFPRRMRGAKAYRRLARAAGSTDAVPSARRVTGAPGRSCPWMAPGRHLVCGRAPPPKTHTRRVPRLARPTRVT
jgi:hypothetical protein